MKPSEKMERRPISPQQVAQYAKKEEVQTIIQSVMTSESEFEFWGCNIGNNPAAMKSWANLFQSKFKATTEKLTTEFNKYWRPIEKGEIGESIPGREGRWVMIKHTSEIDKLPEETREHFNSWLIEVFLDLRREGDMPPSGQRDYDADMAYMRDLFNRAKGDIRALVVCNSRGENIGAGDKEQWEQLWVTEDPVRFNKPKQEEVFDKPSKRPTIEITGIPSLKSNNPLEKGKSTVSVDEPAKKSSNLETLSQDENFNFLLCLGVALLGASNDLDIKEDKRSSLFKRMGWRLGFLVGEVQQGRYSKSDLMKIVEIWAARLNMFTTDLTDKSINIMQNTVLKLSIQELEGIQNIMFPSKQHSQTSEFETHNHQRNEKNERNRILEEQVQLAISQLKIEETSKLENIQAYWDLICGNETLQTISFVMRWADKLLLAKLSPNASNVLGKLTKLWVLRHIGTLFFDVLQVSKGDLLSGRRMMFLDTEATIKLYEYWSQNDLGLKDAAITRDVNVIDHQGLIGLESKRSSITQLGQHDVIRGLTLEKFARLYLLNPEQALQLADLIGSYVWEKAPRYGSPSVAQESMRRINEYLKLVIDSVKAVKEIYGVFNKVWFQAQFSIGPDELWRNWVAP